ncbi:MAG: putative enzyme [Promethearchaeota archaeon]|nr:MAG: putative enzyme [Candidatus Lokiarchaeota archaeon]
MKENNEPIEVSIIGGGFSGLYLAILLKMKGITCEIFTSGTGASQFWVGTVDFLDYRQNRDLERSFKEFQKEVPHHPYSFFPFSKIERSFTYFFSQFPDFKMFTENEKLINRPVLTSLGNLKPCIGIWHSIFHEFQYLTKESTVILVDFSEFFNDVMYLVAKNLHDTFACSYRILNLSFKTIFDLIGENGDEISIKDKLSEYRIASFFDTHSSMATISILGNYIKKEIIKQFPKLDMKHVDFILFPPILGLKTEKKIIEELSKLLNLKCKELVALSPSLISKRFDSELNEKIKSLDIPLHKNYTFIDFNKDANSKMWWKLKFMNKKGDLCNIHSKCVVFAVGTLFQEGPFANVEDFKEIFNKNLLSIPISKISPSYELTFHNGQGSNIFVAGSALFSFIESITEEDEIKYGTGLGLSILTSTQIAEELNRLK